MSDTNSETTIVPESSDSTVDLAATAGGDSAEAALPIYDDKKDISEISINKELSDTESVIKGNVDNSNNGRMSPAMSDAGSVRSTASKASGLRQPTRIGRPCCTGAPKPGLPPVPKPQGNNTNISNTNGCKGTTIDASSRRSSEDRSKKLSVSSNASLDTLWEYYPRRLSEAGLRRHSDASQVLTEDTDSFIIGDHVWVGGTKPGQIAYIGETQFAPGEWAGIVLDEPIGKNDGSVSSVRYFQCEPRRGIFSRLTRLTRIPLESPPTIRENVPTTPTVSSSVRNSTAATRSKQISPTTSVRTLSTSKNLNVSNTSLASISNGDLKIGDRVIVRSSATTGSKPGILRFIGATQFAPGEWCGVELDDPIGKNDGSVDGISYFDCQPFYGLFATINKVSKSPSTRRPSACVVHRPGSTTPGLRRSNSRESLMSMNSSIASSVRTTASRVRLGVTSLSTPKGLAKPIASTPYASKTSLQESIREKDQQISKLLRERELDRSEVTRAASQADYAEQMLATLRKDYDKFRLECEVKLKEKDGELCKIQSEKERLLAHIDEEKRKAEDLQFQFEEAAVHKGDVEVSARNYLVRIKELENSLNEERKRVEILEQDSNKLFEAEEELTKIKDELDQMKLQFDRQPKSSTNILDLTKQLGSNTDLERMQKENTKVENKNMDTLYSKSLETINEQKNEIELLKLQLHKSKDELQMKTRDLCEVAKNSQDELVKENNRLKLELNAKALTIENYTEEIKKRDNEIAELRVKLETTQHEVTLKDATIDHHIRSKREAEVEFKKNIEQKEDELKKTQQEFEEHKKDTTKKLLNAETDGKSRRAIIVSHENALAELQNQLQNAQVSAVASASSQSHMQEVFIQQKDMKILQLNSQFEAKCTELAHCHDVNTKQVQELHQKAAQIETYKRDFELLYQKLQEQETVNCNLTAKLNAMELNVGDLHRKLTTSTETIQIITNEKHRLEVEIQSLLAKETDIDGQLSACNNKYNVLAQQMQQCRNDFTTQQHTFSRKEQEYQQTINQLQVQLNNERGDLGKKLQDALDIKSQLEQKCQNQIVTLQHTIESLKTELNQLTIVSQQKQESALKTEHNLQQTIHSLRAEISKITVEYQNRIKMCEGKESHFQSEINELNILIKQKNDLIVEMESKCKQMFTDCQNQCQGMQQQCNVDVKKCNEEVTNLRQQISQRDQHLNELNIKISNMKQTYIILETKFNEMNKENDNLKIEITHCKQSMDVNQQDLNAKNHQLQILTTEIKQVTDQKAKCEAMFNSLHKQFETVTNEYTQMKENFVINQRHCADKDMQIKSLEELKLQYEQQKNIINIQVQQKDNKIQELLHTIEIVKQQQCMECEGRKEQLQKQCDSHAAQCSKREQDIHTLQMQINDMSIDCNRAKAEITIWRNEYEKVKNQSNIIEQHCSDKDAQIINLRNQITIITQQKDNEANHRIQVLEQQINQYKIEYTSYQQQCEQRIREFEQCKKDIEVTKQEVCQESENRLIILKQECDQVKLNYNTLDKECQKKQHELLVIKQTIENNQHQCNEMQNKFIVLQKDCSNVQQNYHNLQRECENRIIELKMCAEKLKVKPEEGPKEVCKNKVVFVPQPCGEQPQILNMCEEQKTKIIILEQQLDEANRGVCNQNVVCRDIIDQAVQQKCNDQNIRLHQVNIALQNCQDALLQRPVVQKDTLPSDLIHIQNCLHEKTILSNQCANEKKNLQLQITKLESQNLRCVVLEKELQQKDILIQQIRLEESRKCEHISMNLEQRQNEIIYLKNIITQLQSIKNSSNEQQNTQCKLLQVTVQQKQMEIDQKTHIIEQLNVKINELLKLQNEASRCQLLSLQLQQKNIEIQTQATLIQRLQEALQGMHVGNGNNENMNIFQMEIQKLNQYLQRKDQIIFKLQTELQQCQRNPKLDDHTSNCQSFIDQMNQLRTELHWEKVHSAEFESKFHLLANENAELLRRLRACVNGCSNGNGNGSVVISTNWEIERLTLLEQIAELKCELESRAKELIICKTRLPCSKQKNTLQVDLKTALEQAHQEKFSQFPNIIGSGGTASVSSGGEFGSSSAVGTVVSGSGNGNGWHQFQQANSQIQFLNSIIVDMQQKNEQLRAKIETLEATCLPSVSQPMDNLLKPRIIPPRMFCDICDEFDLHETEDCPNQDSELMGGCQEATFKRHPPKNVSSERPYCDICEAFGHSTEDCDETETF